MNDGHAGFQKGKMKTKLRQYSKKKKDDKVFMPVLRVRRAEKRWVILVKKMNCDKLSRGS